MLRGSQEQEHHVKVLPREVGLQRLTWLCQIQSHHRRWMLDEKEAQPERWTTVERAFFFVFFEMFWKGRRLRMIAKVEVGRKESVEMGVARVEVVEVSEERGTGST